jgi:hypothetical protein
MVSLDSEPKCTKTLDSGDSPAAFAEVRTKEDLMRIEIARCRQRAAAAKARSRNNNDACAQFARTESIVCDRLEFLLALFQAHDDLTESDATGVPAAELLGKVRS